MNKTDEDLCPHGAKTLTEVHTQINNKHKVQSTLEGGKFYGKQRAEGKGPGSTDAEKQGAELSGDIKVVIIEKLRSETT